MTIRTFIAISLPDDVKTNIVRVMETMKKVESNVRWVQPSSLHLTLKFLGNIETTKIKDVTSCLEEVSKKYKPFSFSLNGLGVFPNEVKPRVFWIGVKQGKEILEKMQQDIEERLWEKGFAKEERPFSPHLTVGRVANTSGGERLGAILGNIHFEEQFVSVNELLLMKSDLKPSGAVYSRIAGFKLET